MVIYPRAALCIAALLGVVGCPSDDDEYPWQFATEYGWLVLDEARPAQELLVRICVEGVDPRPTPVATDIEIDTYLGNGQTFEEVDGLACVVTARQHGQEVALDDVTGACSQGVSVTFARGDSAVSHPLVVDWSIYASFDRPPGVADTASMEISVEDVR